jgi:type IV secretion system protein VirB4
LTIKSFPQPQGETETRGYTVPGMLDKLMTVPGDIKFTQVFRYASKSASMKHMKTVKRYNDIAKHGWKGMLAGAIKGSMEGVKVNSGRAKDNTQIEDAEGNLSVDQGTTGWYNCTMICYGDTLEHACDLAEIVESTIRGVKFIPFPEKEHCLSAWAGTIPGQHGEIVRWLFLDNANVANLMPLRTVSRGQIVNEYLTAQLGIPCPPLAVMSTDYGTPFYYVHYVMHVGHKLFMGPSRTGKTTLANYLWTAFRKYLRARVITFDIDYSTRVPILLQGGKYIDLGDESSQRPKLNPLVLLKEGKHLGYLVRFVKLLCEMRGYSVNASQEVEIEHALLATRSLAEGDPAMLRLLTVYTQITDHLLQEQLQLWVGERPYAKYFDNVEDHFDLNEASSLLGLETRTILRDEMIAVPFMDLAFHRIQSQMSEEREKGLIVPTVIYIPECWYFLKNKQFANQIENYLKTIARYASSLWMDTQSPDELMVSGVFGSMRDNIKTVVYAPNKKAKSASLYKIYATEFGLSDSQIMRIADAQAQRDYFIKQDDLSRMVQPCFDKETIAMLGSDRRAQVTFDRHYRNGHPEHPNWKQNYVDEMLNKAHAREVV